QHAAVNADDPTISPWVAIKDTPSVTSSPAIDTNCPAPPEGSFYIQPTGATDGGKLVTASPDKFVNMNSATARPYAQLVPAEGKSHGIWIEKQTSPSSGEFKGQFTFTVRACWYGAGINVPMQLDTTVRLYDPLS